MKNWNEYTDKELMSMPELERNLVLYERAKHSGRTKNIDYTADKEIFRQNDNYKIRMDGFLPSTQNFCNWRSFLKYKELIHGHKVGSTWKYIRDFHEKHSIHKCIICGHDDTLSGALTATEAHEVWLFKTDVSKQSLEKTMEKLKYKYTMFDDFTEKFEGINYLNIQLFDRIESLCNLCHSVKHLNRLFNNKDSQKVAIDYYCMLNNIDVEQAQKDYTFAFDERAKINEDKFYLFLGTLNIKNYDDEIKERLIDYEYYLPFNCHTEEFQRFVKKEMASGKDES